MQYKNALKALAAKQIAVVELTNAEDYNRRFIATVNGHVLTIHTQGKDIATMRVRRVNDEDEPQSDYCAGSFYDTMPQVFQEMGIA